MTILTRALIALVALSHVGFMILEMVFWDHPVGRRIFNMTPEVSASSAVLAANQGLYNGFLAAGLAWALWSRPPRSETVLPRLRRRRRHFRRIDRQDHHPVHARPAGVDRVGPGPRDGPARRGARVRLSRHIAQGERP